MSAASKIRILSTLSCEAGAVPSTLKCLLLVYPGGLRDIIGKGCCAGSPGEHLQDVVRMMLVEFE